MNNKEKINKLLVKRDSLHNELKSLRKEIAALELEGMDYTGKIITIPTYGTMYVWWQRFEENSIYGDERMFLQGMFCSAETGEYQDDCWIDCSGWHELYIPYDAFVRYHNNGEIVEVSEEDFKKMCEDSIDAFKSYIPRLINFCKHYNDNN